MITPVELWCYECSRCTDMSIMTVIGTTNDIDYTEETCDFCGWKEKVKLPETWREE